MSEPSISPSSQKDDKAGRQKIVYLMRGLPSSGKSHTARRLAGQHGLVCETDLYFYTEVGSDPRNFDYDAGLLASARKWNLQRFIQAMEEGRSPIIVDRGNSLSISSQVYARCAVERDYRVALREPDSPWWAEIRVLLKYPQHTGPILDKWADRLGDMNKKTHRTSAEEIRRRMYRWKSDLTVEDILRYRPSQDRPTQKKETLEPREEVVIPMRNLMVGTAPQIGVDRKISSHTSQLSAGLSGHDELLVFDEEEGKFS